VGLERVPADAGVADPDRRSLGDIYGERAINNSIARVAGLVGVSVLGVVVAGSLAGDTFAPNDESVQAFHQAVVICAALLGAGGLAGALGVANPRRTVSAESCPGGQLVGVPEPAVASSRPHAATAA
jgi:hypothetical protein